MMYSVSLPAVRVNLGVCRRVTRLLAGAALGLTIGYSGLLQAQTLVEELKLPNPRKVITGKPIEAVIEVNADSQSAADKTTSYDNGATTEVRQYRLGSSTFREYRDGKRLRYVEIENDIGSVYVVNHDQVENGEKRSRRSGIRIGRW